MNVAIVEGVLEKNTGIRNRLLQMNAGKYSQYAKPLNPVIGEAVRFQDIDQLVSLTGGESLLDYTHNGGNMLSDYINNVYFTPNENKEIISFQTPDLGKVQRWQGKYSNYINYLDEILGEDIYSEHVKFINNLLSGEYIENALRQNELGVVRDFNVAVAKQGVITTNKNNLSGKDTQLGTITNYMYSTLLYNGAIFNSDRHSEKKYLTPSLINQYGNNLANVMELSDIMRIGRDKYHIDEDLGEGVRIIHSDKDDVGNLNVKYLTDNQDAAKKYVQETFPQFKGFYFFDGTKYIDINEELTDGLLTFKIGSLNDFAPDANINLTPKKKLYVSKSTLTVPIYSEGDHANDVTSTKDTYSESEWERYSNINPTPTDNKSKSLLSKTAQMFKEHKIKTMIGRFYLADSEEDKQGSIIDTAVAEDWGKSHGRNLLTDKAQYGLTADNINGYDNPYCRVWTFHHQYDNLSRLIRPFIEDGKFKSIASIQAAEEKYRSVFSVVGDDGNTKLKKGGEILAENTVLGENGFVNITPKGTPDANDRVGVEKCMFSIENLAWKDIQKNSKNQYLSKEQRGPNGGRIMWFPPYGLDFQENINVQWSENTFIGRGEKVYTYTDTERSGTLSFVLLIDHPAIVNSFAKPAFAQNQSFDPDAEVLRFFAGCSIPEVPTDTDEERKPGGGEEIERIRKTGKMSFRVYFPNNYSGVMTRLNHTDNSGIVSQDEAWWKRLLIGRSTVVFDGQTDGTNIYDSKLWTGYDVTEDAGLSTDVFNGTTDEERKYIIDNRIPTCQTWATWPGTVYGEVSREKNIGQDCPDGNDPLANKTTGRRCYQYPVDPDLRQVLYGGENSVNYLDNKSFRLNSKFNPEYHDEDAVTFAEFIYAMLQVKPEVLIGAGNDDFKEDLMMFLISKGGIRVDESGVEKIKKIVTATDFSIVNISITGGATERDKQNSKMLAKRRSMTVHNLLSQLFPIDNDENDDYYKGDVIVPNMSSSQSGQTISCVDDKKQRSVNVVIDYEYYITEASSYKTTQNGQKTVEQQQEEQEQQDKFDEWYNKMVEGGEFDSTLMDEYSDMLNSELSVPSGLYDKWKQNVHDYVDESGIDITNQEMFNTAEKYNMNFLDNLLAENENPDLFIPAFYISRDGSNTEFANQLKSVYESKPTKDEQQQQIKDEYDKTILEEDIDISQTDISTYQDKIDTELIKIQMIGGDDCCNGIVNKDTSVWEYIECTDCCSDNRCSGGQIGEKLAQIDPINQDIKALQEDIDIKTDELNEVNDKLANWATGTAEKRELQKQQKKLSNEINAANTKIGKLTAQRQRIESDIRYLRLDIESGKSAIQKYCVEIANLSGKIEDNNSQIEKIDGPDRMIPDLVKSELYFYYYGSNLDIDNYIYDVSIPYQDDMEIIESSHVKEVLTMCGGEPYEYFNDGNILSYGALKMEYNVINWLSDINAFGNACEILFEDPDQFEKAKYLLCFKDYLERDPNDWEYLKYLYRTNRRIFTDIIGYQPLTDAMSDIVSHGGNPLDYVDNVIKYATSQLDSLHETIMASAEEQYANDASVIEEEKQRIIEEGKPKEKTKEEQAAEDMANAQKAREQAILTVFKDPNAVRYENEGEYFARLKETDPVVFKKIVDKYGYFDPAFHSMSPEGFNARLNFLHQCTRQGHTIESSTHTGFKAANNLAFGRMPVCVLRIGDFIKTKIIIKSMSINYAKDNGMQWDLNPEGAGVQPMWAKVDLGIVILGGQSLNGPINRLQNANTFNYYANTCVYDNRADLAEYDQNGEIKYTNIFVPENNAQTTNE